jgi:FkbM family methyltransferase
MNFRLVAHNIIYKLMTSKSSHKRLGKKAGWHVNLEKIHNNSLVISAGAGHDISFELELIEKKQCRIVLLDPSPTGMNTISKTKLPKKLFFLPMALLDLVGEVKLAPPIDREEGSWRMAADNIGEEMPCTTVSQIMSEYSISSIDLLKIDIEGFEYQVLYDILQRRLAIRQICVEIHQGPDFQKTRYDRWRLVTSLYRAGYRLIHSEGWDHTFLHRDCFKK